MQAVLSAFDIFPDGQSTGVLLKTVPGEATCDKGNTLAVSMLNPLCSAAARVELRRNMRGSWVITLLLLSACSTCTMMETRALTLVGTPPADGLFTCDMGAGTYAHCSLRGMSVSALLRYHMLLPWR